tara:strand:- start:1217 stop:2083 length:867 start_codon:yes stop_codon:yes gene_type:complete
MEKQSQNNASRRHRGNRSGGGNRNRSRSGGNRDRNRRGNRSRGGGGGGGNRNRSRNRSRRRQAPKPTTWQKFLQLVSFGKLGQPKRRSRKKQQTKQRTSASNKASRQRSDNSNTRRRQRIEVTSGRLYVGNLTYATTEEELEELFRGFGTVISAEVVTNSRTQQSKGFAFVEMASVEQAKRAVEILDDQDFMGRKITVSGARSEGPKETHDAPHQAESEATENPVSEDGQSEGTAQDEATNETCSEAASEEPPAEDSTAELDPQEPLKNAAVETVEEENEQKTTESSA